MLLISGLLILIIGLAVAPTIGVLADQAGRTAVSVGQNEAALGFSITATVWAVLVVFLAGNMIYQSLDG